jgi:hypothetical protein
MGVAIKTFGTDSSGVRADSGGMVTLNGGSVTTSGLGSAGLFVTGAGSSLTAAGVAVSTSANLDPSTNAQSNGLDVRDGATATFPNGSARRAMGPGDWESMAPVLKSTLRALQSRPQAPWIP